MAEENEKIVIEPDTPAVAPPPPGDNAEPPIVKGEDFSSEAEPVVEATLAAEEAGTPPSKVEELEERLLRTAAEFENYRKRSQRQTDELVRSANDRMLVEILEICDNLERALQHAGEGTDPNALRQGVAMIYQNVQALLGRYQVTPLESVGQRFDPALHDAMLQVDSEEFAEGVVAMEIAKGYRQGERIIRHAKVGVSKGKSGDNA